MGRVQVKVWGKYVIQSSTKKKSGVTITRGREGHHVIRKGSILQITAIRNLYAPNNRAAEGAKQTLTGQANSQ